MTRKRTILWTQWSKNYENRIKIRKLWHFEMSHFSEKHNFLDQSLWIFKCDISKCNNFLISYPIFVNFAPFWKEKFSRSNAINYILDRTSPLIMKNARQSDNLYQLLFAIYLNDCEYFFKDGSSLLQPFPNSTKHHIFHQNDKTIVKV